jgi:hypothetical protein
MKRYVTFLFIFFNLNLYSIDLNIEDVEECKHFIDFPKTPKIIQEKEYIEKEDNKITYKHSFNVSQIQGIYYNHEIHLYEVSNTLIPLNLQYKTSCLKIEKFLKKGFLIHELTHFKQEETKPFDNTIDKYENSKNEEEAFYNQIMYFKYNGRRMESEFSSCFEIPTYTYKEWFTSFIVSNKDTHEIFINKKDQFLDFNFENE